MDVAIRIMEVGDIEGVLEIEGKSFPTPWSYDAFYKEITVNALAVYIVALKDTKIIGYGGMWILFNEAHITNIAVSPDYRKRGIGRMIMIALMVKAINEKCNLMTLEVRTNNFPAISLYKELGFGEAGIRKGYYTDTGDDALIMWNHNLTKTLKGIGAIG